MFNNKLRYFLVAVVILFAAAFALTLGASIVQNWQCGDSGTLQSVANIDGNGGLNITGSGSINLSGSAAVANYTASSGSVTALTAGTLSVVTTFAGTNCKEVIISSSSLTSSGNTTLTWSPSFAYPPAAFSSLQLSGTKTGFASSHGTGGIVTALTTTSATISAISETGSGTIIVRGN